MILRLNKKTRQGEILFSWKEIFRLIFNKKILINEVFLDRFTGALINMKFDIVKANEENQKVDK